MKKILSKLLILLTVFTFTNLNFAFAETYPDLCSTLNRTLKIGDTGTDVRRLQVVLGQEGIAYLSATGYFGNATSLAVKTFQTRNGIYPVGKVGPQTLNLMRTMWCTGNSGPIDNTYIPINTNNPELNPIYPGFNYNNTSINGISEISLQPISSSGNNVTLGWATRNVQSCSLQQDYSNTQNVQTNGQQIFNLYGQTNFTLKCINFSGREISKTIVVRPNQATLNLPTVNVTINPAQIIIGQTATLYWTSNNTSYCTSNVGGYNSNLQISGSLPITISSNTQSFTFTCYNSTGQSISQTITASSNTTNLIPTINNFTYSNNLLAWGTSNANSCTLTGGNLYGQTVQVNGSYPVNAPTTNTTWTLTCYGNTNQSVTRQVNYSIYTTCIDNNTCNNNGNTITADANTDAQQYRNQTGQTINFYCPANLSLSNVWGSDIYSDDSSICSAAIHAGKITQAVGGNVSVIIGAAQNIFTSLYRNGVTSIYYGYWPGSFTFTGTTNSGNITLVSQAGNVVTVSIPSTGGSINWGDGQSTSLGTIYCITTPCIQNSSHTYTNSGTYNITYNNSTLTVVVTGTNNNNVTSNLSANYSNVSNGQAVTLTWTSTNANYCSIVANNSTIVSNQSSTGSTIVYPTQNTNYVLTCYNNNGQNNAAYVYITVNNNNTNTNVTANISANYPSITSGQQVTLSWYSSNANTCSLLSNGSAFLNNQNVSGTYLVTPTQSTNYGVTCTNTTNGQSSTNYAYVTVNGNNNGNSITLISNSYKLVTVQVNNYTSNNTYINWGDGQTTYISQTGSVNQTHQYNYSGTFQINLISNGNTIGTLQVYVQ